MPRAFRQEATGLQDLSHCPTALPTSEEAVTFRSIARPGSSHDGCSKRGKECLFAL